MGIFDRRRRPPTRADLGPGFWLTEPLAVQGSIAGALTAGEKRRQEATAQLQLSPGADGRVVVLWRSRIVGFVPTEHAPALLEQLADAPKQQAAGTGWVVRHDDVWRIWAGDEAPTQPPPPARLGELGAETPKILGIPVPTRGGRKNSAPTTAAAPTTATTTARVLTAGTHSWDVREGDVDLALLRRRLRAAEPGATLHVRIRDETVEIPLSPGMRVTISDGTPETAEVLYPAD